MWTLLQLRLKGERVGASGDFGCGGRALERPLTGQQQHRGAALRAQPSRGQWGWASWWAGLRKVGGARPEAPGTGAGRGPAPPTQLICDRITHHNGKHRRHELVSVSGNTSCGHRKGKAHSSGIQIISIQMVLVVQSLCASHEPVSR